MSNTNLSNLAPQKGATKKRKRVGRGQGSTLGKTAGRGQKGQKSRSGGSIKAGFEGGQMPLHRRLPKFGFTPPRQVVYEIVNLDELEIQFDDGATIELESLKEAGLVRSNTKIVKILGRGELTKKFTVKTNKISQSAKEKIEAAGGTVEVI